MPKCKWCGRTFEKGGFNKFKSSWTLGIAGRESYCSRQCEVSAVHGNNSVMDSERPSFNPFRSNSRANEDNNAELARIQLEKEQFREKLEAEKASKREAKAEILREQGKPFMAFVVVNQDKIGYGLLFGLVFGIPIIFSVTNALIGIIVCIIVVIAIGLGTYKYLKEMLKK